MTNLELQKAFEIEASNIDNYLTDKMYSSDIEYWLNLAIDKFVKTRFDGDNPTRKSFEQNEKRSRDIINLIKTVNIIPESMVTKPNCVLALYTYPSDLLYVLAENITGEDADKTKTWYTTVFECSVDNYMQRVNNKLTDFHYRNDFARPLRVRTSTGCMLVTEDTYTVTYDLTYIKTPSKVDLMNHSAEYKDLTDSALNEVVKLAVQMYIESVGSKRYQTITNEVNTME